MVSIPLHLRNLDSSFVPCCHVHQAVYRWATDLIMHGKKGNNNTVGTNTITYKLNNKLTIKPQILAQLCSIIQPFNFQIVISIRFHIKKIILKISYVMLKCLACIYFKVHILHFNLKKKMP